MFDHCVPAKLRHPLAGHQVERTAERGWSEMSNGDLLSAAEESGFQVLLTVDKRIQFQQNMVGRNIALLVLRAPKTTLANLLTLVPDVLVALPTLKPGEVRVIQR